MEVKIQSTKFIKPSKSTPENRRYFKLSLLDQLAPSEFVNLIFYYKASGTEVNISDRVDQLAKSLSEVLSSFYPLAGRITEDGLAVDCRDQGVEFFETQVSTTLDEFMAHGSKIDPVHQLIATPDQVRNTLVIVQVNVFDCSSLVIGVGASHKVTDACNLVRFINAWASTNRTRTGNGLFSPSFDNLGSLFPPRETLSIEHSPVSVKQETITVTKRFRFDSTAITKLRAKAGLENSKHSRVTLVASLVWKALILVDQVKSGTFRDCLLAPAMNLRGKVGSPISESSFGNVWAPYLIHLLKKEMEPKFVDLVSLIEDTTKSIITWLAKASGEEICTHAMASYAKANEELKQNKFCMFTSWCRFPIYEADFGWGNPDWARAAESSLEMVVLMDDKHGDGIESWVSLNEKDMHVFEQDQDILAFTTSTISEVA